MVEDAASGRAFRAALHPKDVFDKRAVEKDQVVFYDVAYRRSAARTKGREVTVTLKDFGVYYRQDEIEACLAGEMKPALESDGRLRGRSSRSTKDKNGIVKREVLTKKWTGLDRLLGGRFRLSRTAGDHPRHGADATGVWRNRPQWTGGYIFENEWQSFRTRRDRTLELTSAPHRLRERKGHYKIAVKVIDIFGNDTTKVIEVTV